MTEREYLREYDELIAATQTTEARMAMREAGLENGKQLLLAALFHYLKREPYLSPEEEDKALKRGRSGVQPPPKKAIVTETEKTRTLYGTHRHGKRFRFVDCGVSVECADGTLHVFLDRMPIGGWTGHFVSRGDNARPTARDLLASTPFDEDAMLTAEASSAVSH